MNITINRNDNVLTVALEGRLDTLTSSELEERLESELEDIKKLIFDFEALEYISSAGLRVLLAAAKEMETNEGEMIIIKACKEVMDVFKVTGFVDFLIIE